MLDSELQFHYFPALPCYYSPKRKSTEMSRLRGNQITSGPKITSKIFRTCMICRSPLGKRSWKPEGRHFLWCCFFSRTLLPSDAVLRFLPQPGAKPFISVTLLSFLVELPFSPNGPNLLAADGGTQTRQDIWLV